MKFRTAAILAAALSITACSSSVNDAESGLRADPPSANGSAHLQGAIKLLEGSKLHVYDTKELFRAGFAALDYATDTLKKSKDLTEEDRAARIKKIEDAQRGLAEIYETIAPITPWSFALNIMVGAEIPVPFMTVNVPLIKKAKVDASFAVGVVIAGVGSEDGTGPKLAIGGASANGVILHNATQGSEGVMVNGQIRRPGFMQWQFPAVSIIRPTNNNFLPDVKLDDIQGTYVGFSGEMNTDSGVISKIAKSWGASILWRFGADESIWPDTYMFVINRNVGTNNSSIQVGVKGLYYYVAAASDGTNNIPNAKQNSVPVERVVSPETTQRLHARYDEIIKSLKEAQAQK